MKFYILTCAAVLSENGMFNSPDVSVKLFLSPVEAQLEMLQQMESEKKEALANGFTITEESLYQTSALLSYKNVSQSDLVWDITEQDIPVSAYATREDNICFITDFVMANGHPKDDGTTVLDIPNRAKRVCVGGWLGDNNETVKALIFDGETLIVSSEYDIDHDTDQLPSDDLDEIRNFLAENADLIKGLHEYYQPELIATKDVPDGLASFQAFPTKEDCRTWMDRHGYLEGEYEILSYSDDDIEDVTILNGDGDVIYCIEDTE